MKPDQERVKNLLTDTVSMLCRNGLAYQDELRVEGLIGITLDNNEVFLVHINQKFGEAPPRPAEDAAEEEEESDDDQIVIVKTEKVEKPKSPGNKSAQGMTPQRKNINQERRVAQSSPLKRPAPRMPSGDGGPPVKVKQEVKQEPCDPGEDPRVPPLHGQLDDQQQFSGQAPYKQQMSDGSGSDSSSYLLPNLQDSLTAPGFNTGDGSAWSGQPFPTAITRVNNDGTFESAPGTSGWSPGGTQGGGNQMANMNFPQAGQMMVVIKEEGPVMLGTSEATCVTQDVRRILSAEFVPACAEPPLTSPLPDHQGPQAAPDGLDPESQALRDPREQLDEMMTSDGTNISKVVCRRSKNSAKVFRDWLKDNKPECVEFEWLPSSELAGLLQGFYKTVRKKTGELYKASALYVLRSGLNFYLNNPPVNRPLDITQDLVFAEANREYSKVTKNEVEPVEMRKPISREDFARMYASGAVGIHSSVALQRKVFCDVGLHLCGMGKENIQALRPDSLQFHRDSHGSEYVQLSAQFKGKAYHYKGTQSRKIMVAQSGNAMCPVRSLKLYLSKLPTECKVLFPRARLVVMDSQETWYKDTPLGQDKLQNVLHNISKEANLSEMYTNFSLQRTGPISIMVPLSRENNIGKAEPHEV